MKILLIEETYRRWLYRRRAIGFDSDLNEILAGLTHEESVFYVSNDDNLTLSLSGLTEADLVKFVELYERHVSATSFVAGPWDVTVR